MKQLEARAHGRGSSSSAKGTPGLVITARFTLVNLRLFEAMGKHGQKVPEAKGKEKRKASVSSELEDRARALDPLAGNEW